MQVVEVDLRNQSDLIDVDGLQYYKNLARLNLSGCSAVQGDEQMKKTVSILNNVSTLVSLDVSQNKLQALEAAVLAQGIATWALTSLNLSSNDLQAKGATIVAEAMKDNRTMTSLSIASNSIGIEGAKIIATVLPKCTALTSLNIGDNGIGLLGWKIDVTGAIALANSIKDMKALTKLVLRDNSLATAEAGEALGEALKCNTVLKELDISSNVWSPPSWEAEPDGPGFVNAISKGLAGNGAILSVNLLSNGIGFSHHTPIDQAKALGSMLKEHPTLKSLCGNMGDETELDMSGKNMGASGAIMLAAEIVGNGAMTSLNLSSNALGELVLPAGWTKEHPYSSYKHSDGREQKDHPGEPEGIIAVANAIKDMGALSKLDARDNYIPPAEKALLQGTCDANMVSLGLQ
jgi:Leucine-rich repeat (LRR) protein